MHCNSLRTLRLCGEKLVLTGLLTVLFLSTMPAWGGQPQLCLACHPVHHEDLGRCTDCHHGNPASRRKNLAHAGLRAGKYVRFMLGDEAYSKEGERLMELLACRRCHVSGGRGNRLAVSLDGAVTRKTAGELVLSIRKPVANMPNFSLTEERTTMLVNAILAGSQGHETAETVPVQVHFNTSGKKRADVFSVKCGGCHRMLSERLGALGTGDSGPNLSGLFSPFYPKSFKNSEAWNARNLGAWLKNPRETRPGARMMPVILTEPETKELMQLMADGEPKNKGGSA